MREIIWPGEPLIKEIHYWEHPHMRAEITPQVVMQDGHDPWGKLEQHMGLIVQCQPLERLSPQHQEDTTVPDPLAPFVIDATGVLTDPVRWWRAAQLLVALPRLTHWCDFDLYIAAGRPEPDDNLDQRLVAKVRAALPAGIYEEIMARPVPLALLTWIISRVDAGLNLDAACWHLTKEIAAGTVRWSQDLKRIGVQHPDYRRAVADARHA